MSFVDLARESAIHVRTFGGHGIGRSEDGASFAVEGFDGRILPIGSHAPEFEAANAQLAAGAPLGRLRDAVISAGARPAPPPTSCGCNGCAPGDSSSFPWWTRRASAR